jgi:putative tryptophan/tyrosine transport system substrate-binding protein
LEYAPRDPEHAPVLADLDPFGRGDPSRAPQLATELVALPVDVIVAEGFTPDAVAATDHIPIVAPALMDPVERGFALSLARPGRNVTGFTLMHTDLNGKRLELLRTASLQIRMLAGPGMLGWRGEPSLSFTR